MSSANQSFGGFDDLFKGIPSPEVQSKIDYVQKNADYGAKQPGETAEPTKTPVARKEKKAIASGTQQSIESSMSLSNYLTAPDGSPALALPDYYRNGNLTTEVTSVDNKNISRTFWKPMPGMVEDRETPMLASIKLVNSDLSSSKDPDSTANQLLPAYSKFFLESVNENHQERVQTVETFNDFYVYFYGERPPIYTFSGHLLNFRNYNWVNEFMFLYTNFWRGTKATAKGAKVYITYNYQQIHGYILNVQTNLQALTDKAAPFSISMIVTKKIIFSGNKDDGVIRDSLVPLDPNGVNINNPTYANSVIADYKALKRGAIEKAAIDVAAGEKKKEAMELAQKRADDKAKYEKLQAQFEADQAKSEAIKESEAVERAKSGPWPDQQALSVPGTPGYDKYFPARGSDSWNQRAG
jgi:hypothetical protein